MRKMKDSGIAWIGEIPAEWKVKRIKHIIIQTKDGIKIGPFGSALTNKTHGNGEYNVYSQANLISANFSSTKNTIDKNTFDELKSYEVYPNDICLSMMGTIGKCLKVPDGIKRGIMDSHLIKIRLSGYVDSRFFEYTYDKDLSGVCFQQMQYDKKGFIMDGLNTSIVKNLYFPLPPLDEQRRIAAFLDEKCAHIDAVIEKTRISIDEYKKLKQAIITRAVTKGLRQGRKVKDSGIEWIGEIPEEWETRKIKHISSLVTDGAHVSPETDDGIYDFVSTVNVNNDIIDFSSCLKTSAKSYEYLVANGCKPLLGDVLISKDGTVGKTVIVKENRDFVVASSLVIIRPKQEIIGSVFLNYALQSKAIQERLQLLMHGAGLKRVSVAKNENLTIILPPLPEQQEIAAYLDAKTAAIDRLIAKKEQLIAEMQSCKKSLIYEVVTGKREVAI